jgi:hypothetical protein
MQHTHLGRDDRGQEEEAEEQRRRLVLGGHADRLLCACGGSEKGRTAGEI